tara:strand:- start:4168 stop:4536 length:369 start_codon:yes stop_codon:yes gene_type:complete
MEMNKWMIRGLTAVSAGLVGTYLIMSEGKKRRAKAAAEEAQKTAKWKKGQQKGDEDLAWTEKVKQAGQKVKKNVEESVQTDNIQDRLRNLSSWMEGPGSPGYEREKPDSDDSDAEEVNSEEA